MRKVLKCIILPVVVAAVMLAVEILCQLPLSPLNTADAGEQTIALSEITVTRAEVEEEDEDWEEEEEDWDEEDEDEEEDEEDEEDTEQDEETSSDVLSLNAGDAITFPYAGYIHELTVIGDGSSQAYSIAVKQSSGEARTFNAVYNAQWASDTASIRTDVSEVTLTFTEEITIQSITVSNSFCFNPIRMLVSGLLTCAACLLLMLRRQLGRKPQWAFAIVAVSVGISLCVAIPAALQISQDDQIHLSNIQRLSWGIQSRDTKVSADAVDLYWNTKVDDVPAFRADTLRDVEAYHKALDSDDAVTAVNEPELHWQYAWTGYVVPALGMAAARAMGLPFHMQMIAARLAVLALYVLCVFSAIACIRRYRYLLMTLALMPTALFYACSLSYDGTGIALCFLGTALAVNAIVDHTHPLSNTRGAVMLLSLVLGSLTKMVYMPLLLLVLLIPRKQFTSRFAAAWFKLLSVIMCVAAVASVMVFVTGNADALTDSRGNDADSAAQLAFIMSNPLLYLQYFFNWFISHFLSYFVTDVRMNLYFLETPVSNTIAIVSLVLLVVAALTASDWQELLGSPKPVMRWYQRIGLLLIAGICTGLLMTTMYASFASVGSTVFAGMQPRYLLPLLPCCYMLLSPNFLHGLNRKVGHSFQSFIYSFGSLAVMAAVLFTTVFSRWYL